MVRRIGYAAAFLAVLLLCGACAMARPTIVVYHAGSGGLEQEFYNRAMARFEALHPDINVESLPSGTGGGGDFVEKLAILRVSGNSPDLYEAQADKLGYIMNGWAFDITPYYERDKKELQINDFLPGLLDTFRRGGRIYGLPTSVVGQAVFHNMDMFANAGIPALSADWDSETWTWKDLTDYSRKLVKTDPSGQLVQAPIAQFGEHKLPDISWVFGGDWFREEDYVAGFAASCTIDRPENIAGWKAVQDFYQRGYVADLPESGGDAWGGFAAGTVAMDWIGWWKLKFYRSTSPTFSYAMAPLPKAKTRAHTLWIGTMFVSNDTRYPEAAWQFAKFISSTEALQLHSEIYGGVPARRSALEHYVNQTAKDLRISPALVTQSVSGAVAHGRPALEQRIYGFPDVEKRMADWLTPMVRGQEGVEATISRIKPVIDTILAEWAARAREMR